MKKKFLLTSLIFVTIMLGLIYGDRAFSYSPKETHDPLARKIAEYYNLWYDPDLTPQEIDLLAAGARDEDTFGRWFNHFYDPVYQRGIYASPISRDWAKDQERQAAFPAGDRTWQRALAEYNAGNKKEAYYTLGFIIHLIEDATVPAHTRNDDHGGKEIAGQKFRDYDPYEDWAKNPDYGFFNDLAKNNIRPKELMNLDNYFNQLAAYTNNYFFSKDTILLKEYLKPSIVKEAIELLPGGDSVRFAYGNDEMGQFFRLAEVKEGPNYKSYSLDSIEVNPDYWNRLAPKAVLYGAGVINLFHRDAEKVKTGQIVVKGPYTFWDSVGGFFNAAFSKTIQILGGGIIGIIQDDALREKYYDPKEFLLDKVDVNNNASDSQTEEENSKEDFFDSSTADKAQAVMEVIAPLIDDSVAAPSEQSASEAESAPVDADNDDSQDAEYEKELALQKDTAPANSASENPDESDNNQNQEPPQNQQNQNVPADADENQSGQENQDQNNQNWWQEQGYSSFESTPGAVTNTFLPSVMISQAAAGWNSSANEFIEIYNPNSQPINLSNDNFQLKLVNSSNKITVKRIDWVQNIIPANGYFLFAAGELASEGWAINPDAFFSSQMTDASGVIIADGAGNIKDKVGWGKPSKQPPADAIESAGVILENGLKTNQGLARITDSSGVPMDTDNNTQDFQLLINPSPKNSGGQLKYFDSIAPETFLEQTNLPENPTISTEASFSFTSSEDKSSFECSWDLADWLNCVSPQIFSNLSFGEHKFQVLAIDQVGNRDATPAIYSWIIQEQNAESEENNESSEQPEESSDEGQEASQEEQQDEQEPSDSDNEEEQTNDDESGQEEPQDEELQDEEPQDEEPQDEEPPADTESPQISLALGSDYQITKTEFTIEWSSESGDAASFDIEYKAGQDENWQIFETASASNPGQKIFQAQNDETIYYFRGRAADNAGNQSEWAEIQAEVNTKPIIINEVAWMGASASGSDEWIEFYNRSNSEVDIAGWSIYGADTRECLNFSDADGIASSTIAGGSYIIYANNEDNIKNSQGGSIVDIWDATIGLNNSSPGQLILYDAKDCQGNTVDIANQLSGNWFAGNNSTKSTMERINPDMSGEKITNWADNDGVTINGFDAGDPPNPINGTPKSPNSAFNTGFEPYTVISNGIDRDMTFTKAESPYVFSHYSIYVNPDVVLTIEPGVIIKFPLGAELQVRGQVMAQGTESEPIIFTSIRDDSYGGDTNLDGQATVAGPGDWNYIYFWNMATGESVLDYTVIRYGGNQTPGFDYYWAAVKTSTTKITLTNSTIEYFRNRGVLIENSDSVFENNVIQGRDEASQNDRTCQQDDINDPKGMTLRGPLSANAITGNSFYNNRCGLELENIETETVEISGNNFSGNYYPIYFTASQPQFYSNTVQNNHYNAVIFAGGWPNNQFNITLSGEIPFLFSEMTIPWNAGLTLDAGAILKFKNENSYIYVDGSFQALGGEEEGGQIIITALSDDQYGGDTNNDGDATVPSPGSWRYIIFRSGSSTESILDNTIVRYGGYSMPGFQAYAGALQARSSDFSIRNSTIEYAKNRAVWLNGASIEIDNTVFQHNNVESIITEGGNVEGTVALMIDSANPIITNSYFLDNTIGIFKSIDSEPELDNNIFENNLLDKNWP